MNIPEHILKVTVYGDRLIKTGNGWEVSPVNLKDTLKIDLSASFDDGVLITQEFRIPL